jgi:hypothetical protein
VTLLRKRKLAEFLVQVDVGRWLPRDQRAVPRQIIRSA